MMDHDRVPHADRQLLLSYYGDDFTGSTDVMEVLELAGIPTALYLRPPSPVDIADHPTVRAVGLARASRTWSIEQMDADLPSVFRAMSGLGALTFHYKICSTFDSSPAIGSIGRALEIGQRSVSPAPIPLLVGSPDLGRYCVFGELYARAGRIHRLDRHPTLPLHPLTPMREADLLRHLRLQT
ncbi:MAG: four-carbon acid sugar kinase family protein, partial [Chloroflexi bacterium]|nr:four-carbon acid sugar kinase family protein [Chloroflexota bacterium]